MYLLHSGEKGLFSEIYEFTDSGCTTFSTCLYRSSSDELFFITLSNSIPTQAVSLACIPNCFNLCKLNNQELLPPSPRLALNAALYHSGSSPRATRITIPPCRLILAISLGNDSRL